MNTIGLDLGTTTLSAVAVDDDTGAVRETLNVENGADLAPRQPFERIQDPDAIADRALDMVARLKRGHGVSAIGIDGQMHGILYVDGHGRAVSPLFTWQDGRGDLPLDDATYAGVLSRRTGHTVASGYGLVTHFWHVVNGSVPRRAAKLCAICDYVAMRLTGREVPLTHASTAASLGLFDATRGGWDAGALDRAGIDPSVLPALTESALPAGIDPDGVPVACGIGDNQASFIGSVRELSGAVLVNMGTGGQVSMIATGQAAGGDVEIRPLDGGRSIAVGSVLCGGRSYALLEGFLRSCAKLAGAGDAPLYGAMNRIGLELLADGALPIVDTRFGGTRANPRLRGSICGIGTENFDAGRLVAGTIVGMAREIHDLYERMRGSRDGANVRLIGSGNAIRRNPALKRALELAFGTDMRIPAHREEAAYGAALFGMTAAGVRQSLEQAQGLIRYRI